MSVEVEPIDSVLRKPSTTLSRVVVGTAVGGVSLTVAGLLIFGGIGLKDTAVLAQLPWVQTAATAFITFSVIAFSILCIGRFRAVGGAWALWTGVTYLAVGIVDIFYILSWPGLVGEGSVIARQSNTAAWLGNLAVFCVALMAVTSKLRKPASLRLRHILLVYAIGGVVATAVPALIVVFEDALPRLIVGMIFTPLSLLLAAITLVGIVLAAVFTYRRHVAEHDEILGYLSLSLVVAAFALTFSYLGGKRYDIWWYAGRLTYVLACCSLLVAFLQEGYAIFSRERQRLEERERLLDHVRTQNERLQAQSEEISCQQEELQTQNDELRTINDAIATAQLRLAESEHRYRSLFEQLAEGFAIHEVICDERGQPCDYRFLDVNPAFERQTGLTKDVVGRTARDVLPNIEQRWIDTYGAVALTGQQVHFEDYAQGLDKFYDVIAFSPQIGLFATLFLDVTVRKRAEQLRDECNSLISHDLRSPLTSVLGLSQILTGILERDHRDEDAQMARRIMVNAQRMEVMTRDLSDSVQLEDGHFQLHKEHTNLIHYVTQIVERVEDTEERSRIRIETEPLAAPVPIDTQRFERAITNVLTNALKYSPSDGQVTVWIGRRDGMATVSVADEGAGIPAEDIPHVFERGFRGATAAHKKGLGLGLYIARLIVEAHGGKVAVESVAGRGSTFYLTVPLA